MNSCGKQIAVTPSVFSAPNYVIPFHLRLRNLSTLSLSLYNITIAFNTARNN